MQKQHLNIQGIPAVLWGPPSAQLYIAVHGDQSHKEDTVLRMLAETAATKGYQTLSFDLPEHGGRKGEPRLCNPQNGVADLAQIFDYARTCADNLYLFGCSIGAYFSMLAYQNEPLTQALFLSPILDLQRVVNNMMTQFDISEQRLKQAQKIVTPAKTLYWKDYQYITNHPVAWKLPTELLYGTNDFFCEPDCIHRFSEGGQVNITVMEGGEHYFHTETQLAFFQEWLDACIPVSL